MWIKVTPKNNVEMLVNIRHIVRVESVASMGTGFGTGGKMMRLFMVDGTSFELVPKEYERIKKKLLDTGSASKEQGEDDGKDEDSPV